MPEEDALMVRGRGSEKILDSKRIIALFVLPSNTDQPGRRLLAALWIEGVCAQDDNPSSTWFGFESRQPIKFLLSRFFTNDLGSNRAGATALLLVTSADRRRYHVHLFPRSSTD